MCEEAGLLNFPLAIQKSFAVIITEIRKDQVWVMCENDCWNEPFNMSLPV